MDTYLANIKDFDDEICKDLLKCCPNLDEFETFADSEDYGDYIYKLRLLLTTIDLKKVQDVSSFGGVLQFLTKFPRLKEVDGNIPIDNIQAFLPILTKFSQLTTFSLLCTKDDQGGFAERVETTNQVATRLSAIKKLTLIALDGFNLNSIIFVSKYMTGLEEITLGCFLQKKWNDIYQRLFCNYILNLTRAIEKCRFEMEMNLEILGEYFPLFAHDLFHQTALAGKKTPSASLIINVHEQEEVPNVVTMVISTEHPSKQHIIIHISKLTDLRNLTSKLFKKETLFYNIDEFSLKIPKRSQASFYSQKVTLGIYNDVLDKMPELKQIQLDIPASYKDTKTTVDNKETHTRTQSLVLRASENVDFQTLLNSCPSKLPNLKHLDIYYYSGIWKENIGELELELGKYVLESLTVDMTPVRSITMTHLKKEDITTEDFFVIEALVIGIGERRLYKVSFDLSSVVRIQDDDLQSFVRGVDYLGVRIIVNNLQQLKICMKRESCRRESEDDLPLFLFMNDTATVFDTTTIN